MLSARKLFLVSRLIMEHYTLITGASSGMGALCAKRFSASRKLVLASENLEMLQVVLNQCSHPENHILWHCDFATERESIMDSLGDLLKQHDAVIDEYVHFAGLTKLVPIKSISISSIDSIFNVNFFSILEIIKTLLKKANNNSLRSIVLISSLASARGEAGNSVYAASKGAINSLVYSLARELAPRIRINALLPGAVETPMARVSLTDEFLSDTLKDTPLGWVAQDDVVDYMEFLLSDKARRVTGQALFIDGGRSTK